MGATHQFHRLSRIVAHAIRPPRKLVAAERPIAEHVDLAELCVDV